jgi:hypothetical protein
LEPVGRDLGGIGMGRAIEIAQCAVVGSRPVTRVALISGNFF